MFLYCLKECCGRHCWSGTLGGGVSPMIKHHNDVMCQLSNKKIIWTWGSRAKDSSVTGTSKPPKLRHLDIQAPDQLRQPQAEPKMQPAHLFFEATTSSLMVTQIGCGKFAGNDYCVAGNQPIVAGNWPIVAESWPIVAGMWHIVAGNWPIAAGNWPVVAGILHQ